MYHFINLKIVYHSNRDSLDSKETDTNDAGDDHRYIMALVLLFCVHWAFILGLSPTKPTQKLSSN